MTHRRARVQRLAAKRPTSIVVTARATTSIDPALTERFGRWLDKLLNAPGTPDEARRS